MLIKRIRYFWIALAIISLIICKRPKLKKLHLLYRRLELHHSVSYSNLGLWPEAQSCSVAPGIRAWHFNLKLILTHYYAWTALVSIILNFLNYKENVIYLFLILPPAFSYENWQFLVSINKIGVVKHAITTRDW